MTQVFASPIGLARDPHAEDAWVRNNKYVLPHPDDPTKELVADRASELGKTISNTFTLNMWHQRQIVTGMAMRPRLSLEATLALNDGLTYLEKRRKLQEIAKEAQTVAGSKEPAALGTGYHKTSELIDAGRLTVDQVPEPWRADMIAYLAMLHKMGIVHVPEYTEKIIWVRSLNTCGKFDRLVRYLRHCDKWHVEDLKSGYDMQYGWGENPVQFETYALADMLFDMETETWSPAPEICQELAVLHHLPVGGLRDPETREPLGISQSTLYEVNLSTRIDMPAVVSPAELCLAVKKWRTAKRVGKAVARIQVIHDTGEVVDTPLTWQEQIDLAASEADLLAIRTEARAAGEWHGGLTRRLNERSEILAS